MAFNQKSEEWSMRVLLNIYIEPSVKEAFTSTFLRVASGFSISESPANIELAALAYYLMGGYRLRKGLLLSVKSKEARRLLMILRYIGAVHKRQKSVCRTKYRLFLPVSR